MADSPILGVAKKRLVVAYLGEKTSEVRARNLLRDMGVIWKEGDSGGGVSGLKVAHLNITCEGASNCFAHHEECGLICKSWWGLVKYGPIVTTGEGVCCKCNKHGGETAKCEGCQMWSTHTRRGPEWCALNRAHLQQLG